MSLENCIFEISVNGTYRTVIWDEDNKNKQDFYQIRFRIIYRFVKYEVWVLTPLVAMRCGFFDYEIDAKMYINRGIKTAMMGQFLYRKCSFCNEKNYYPELMCKKCYTRIYKFNPWRIDETQNEKKSDHLGLSMIRHGSSKRSKSFIYGPQAAEKLSDL